MKHIAALANAGETRATSYKRAVLRVAAAIHYPVYWHSKLPGFTGTQELPAKMITGIEVTGKGLPGMRFITRSAGYSF